MKVLKFSLSFCFFVFALLLFIVGASAETYEDALVYDKLTIVSDNAVLTGQTQQMRVEEYTGTGSDLFFWASNNPSVISCTTDGKITGIKEGKATITVKAMFGDGYDTITVYCVQKLANPKTARSKNSIYFTFREPFRNINVLDWGFNINPLHPFFPNLDSFFTGPKFHIKGTYKGIYGSYFYVEYEKNGKKYKCFIPQTSFSDSIASEEIFKQLSHKDMNVFVGVTKDSYVLTTNYKGEVKWSVSDKSIVSFDEKTGKVMGLKPGIATISATANGKTLTCTVHSIYVWPQDWTGAAKEETCVYRAEGDKYVKSSTTLSVGQKFTVKGDMGGDSSWAYGVSENNVWGYIPISHISTKGTVSQYSGMGFVWPVVTPSGQITANYISSPYGKRDTSPNMHKGFDVTTGVSGGIDGYEVVSAFGGEVVYISTSAKNTTGYCVGIKSDIADPISGEYMVAFYMHLKYSPSVRLRQKVSAGDLLGYVGNTGNSRGSHLHFEVNNKNASIGDGSTARQYYAYLINPLFFFMDKTVRINSGCDAEVKYYGSYWYGND